MSATFRRGRRRRAVPNGTTALSITDYAAGDSPWVDALLARVITSAMPRCEHLERGSHRGFVYAAEGVGRCVDCHMGHAPAAAAAFPVGECEASLCGRCGASALLRLVEVVLAEWVVFSAVCSVCEVVLRHEIPAAPAAASVGR